MNYKVKCSVDTLLSTLRAAGVQEFETHDAPEGINTSDMKTWQNELLTEEDKIFFLKEEGQIVQIDIKKAFFLNDFLTTSRGTK